MAENKRHKGHRQRMRERVQSYGLDSLAEHEALEYVLYLTNAQKDTNGIAHDLIDRFGDFAAVLEASEEELCTVEGVGPSTARMLHLLPQISRYYGRSRTSTTRCIKTTEQMGSYLMAKFAWSDYERAMLVSLDSRKRVRAAVWLREGTSDRVSLDIKNVVAAAIKGFADLDLPAYLRKHFGMYGGPEHRVTLRCTADLQGAMRERFGASPIFVPEGKEHFHFDVPVCVSDQFYGWVCGFGGKIEVVSPAEVRDGLRKLNERLAKIHE